MNYQFTGASNVGNFQQVAPVDQYILDDPYVRVDYFAINGPRVTPDLQANQARAAVLAAVKTAMVAAFPTAPPTINEFSDASAWLLGNHGLILREVQLEVNNSNLSPVERFLLSDRNLYIGLVAQAVQQASQGLSTPAVMMFLMDNLLPDAFNRLHDELRDAWLTTNQITADPDLQTRISDEMRNRGLLLDNTNGSVREAYDYVRTVGKLPILVEGYFNKGEIRADAATPRIKAEMVNYLRSINLDYENIALITNQTSGLDELPDGYDEYFFRAYEYAMQRQLGQADPIFQVFNPDHTASWGMDVDYFDSEESQAIIPENIKAGGALFYIYELGERLGIFDVVDMITLLWTQGRLAIGGGGGAAQRRVYSYFKLRDQRLSKEERNYTYKQVLNVGMGSIMSGSVINQNFQTLWNNLLNEVGEFILKSEGNESGYGMLSPLPIFQAIQDLQFNLTEHMTGKAFADVHEMYAQLQSCLDILKDPEIKAQLGEGRNNTMWSVISSVSKNNLHRNVNISASKTAAVMVHKMLTMIAGFEYARRTQFNLTEFLRITEAFILAQSQLGSPVAGGIEDAELVEEDYDAPDTENDFDDFDDWD